MKRKVSTRLVPSALLVALVVFGHAMPALADGGRLLFRKAAGPFIVTFFTTPDPLTKGRADFSIAVERAGRPGLVEDAHVEFILKRADGRGRQFVLHASHAQATSKWLQAANFSLPARGLWHVTVVVRAGQEMGHCSGRVDVRAAGTRHLTWDILPVLLLPILFVLHENRKRKYNRDRRKLLLAAASQARSQPVHLREQT